MRVSSIFLFRQKNSGSYAGERGWGWEMNLRTGISALGAFGFQWLNSSETNDETADVLPLSTLTARFDGALAEGLRRNRR